MSVIVFWCSINVLIFIFRVVSGSKLHLEKISRTFLNNWGKTLGKRGIFYVKQILLKIDFFVLVINLNANNHIL